jgi:hypothetical protein
MGGNHPAEKANEGGLRLESRQPASAPPVPAAPARDGKSRASHPRTVKRVLLLANETVSSSAVLDRIRGLVGGERAEVFVVAPALAASPLKYVAGEVDEAIEAARHRLDASLDALREMGFTASGEVGDSDPNLALQDAIRRFDADEVVIATHPEGKSKWLEQDVVEKARGEVEVPITHVVVDMEKGGRVEAVERVPTSPRTEPPTATAYDLPRVSKRDAAAVILGIVGTIVLGILAILCGGDISEQGMSAGCAIRIGLAIAAFMVSVFHVIALLFFGTVRYRGLAERLAADMLVYGIPPAIVISLIVG